MKVKFQDHSREYLEIKEEIDSAIGRAIQSGMFVGGPEVFDFEQKIGKYLKCKNAVSVNSGTDALFLALKAIGIKKGDEVITTPFTFIATAEAIAAANAVPVFADISLETFNIDPEKIKEKITGKTKAIIVVHLFGRPAEMGKISEIASESGLMVVEDACQAIGAEAGGKPAGTLGDCGCFSFFPTKNLGAYGDGGLVLTDNSDLAEKLRILKNHGSTSKDKYINTVLGVNSRLDSLQAAVLSEKLEHLGAWNEKRSETAGRYGKGLKGVGGIRLPKEKKGDKAAWHQYTIRADNRNGLKKYLEESGIETKIYYPLPLHLQPAFSYLGFGVGDFPEAERAASEVLSLPIYPQLEIGEQEYIIEKIKEFYR